MRRIKTGDPHSDYPTNTIGYDPASLVNVLVSFEAAAQVSTQPTLARAYVSDAPLGMSLLNVNPLWIYRNRDRR